MQLECQVCNRSGHGNHFGVVTCRACAAFFRRTIVQKKTYKCRRDNGTCSMSESEKTICRHCRYQKCISLGMTPESRFALMIMVR
ncbi:unnamed protein product [Nippostrongylus brasiliensis]|uniref:Nuclear hormone receptor,putative (inferred by orthology to a S. mansoni protein) n=1 Tax=Nippostrongylus brasiliensis TaxID=27835 RepID=A0A0N4YMF3_NIPBR|nr:unnamed protein product [Nippostrongylus brasiliensis]